VSRGVCAGTDAGRTRAAEGHGRRLIFRTRHRTDPISGFANNGDAPVPHIQGGPVDEILHDYGRRARALRGALAHFEQLLGRLTHEATHRVTHGELEAMVQAEGSELLRRMIQGYFDQRGAEEPIPARVVGEDGMDPSG